MSLGGDGYRCPYDSDGLVLDGTVKGMAVGGGVVFLVDGRMYVTVGYGPGSAKSLRILFTNSRRVTGSTLSSHSRYGPGSTKSLRIISLNSRRVIGSTLSSHSRYGPGSTKSLQIISSRSRRVTESTWSSHSRNWHISLSIWKISRS